MTPNASKPQARIAIFFKRHWPWLRKVLTYAFFAAVAWLVVSQARSVDWAEVAQGLRSYSWLTIGVALALTLACYSLYASYDLFGRHYIKTPVSRVKAMLVAFISFSFNLNLGAMVGSLGVRYRLYTQLGLGKADVAHVVGMTVTTNWLGYLFLAGLAFSSGTVIAPLGWEVSTFALRLIGVGFVTVVLAYLGLCQFSTRRIWHIRGHELRLPHLGVALLQIGTACLHWLLMASVMFCFLYGKVGFVELLGVLLVSSIAGAIAHIPGALGVLEAVFLLFLGDELSRPEVLAALIAYRAVFYLSPLALAVCLYLYTETILTRNPAPAKS